MDTIGIGMIGSGFMGLTYSEVVARHVRGARLVAVAGGTRAAGLAAEYAVPAEPSIEALLARGDVAGGGPGHARSAPPRIDTEAAAAGKHVLAEKPMAPTVAECDAMIAACALGRRQPRRGQDRTLSQDHAASQAADRRGSDRPDVDDANDLELSDRRDPRARRISPLDGRPGERRAVHGDGHAQHRLPPLAHRRELREGLRPGQHVQRPGSPAQSVMAQIVFDNGVMAHMWIIVGIATPGLPQQRSPLPGRRPRRDASTWRTSSSSTWARGTSGSGSRRPSGSTTSRSRNRPIRLLSAHRRDPGVRRQHPRTATARRSAARKAARPSKSARPA